MADMELDIHFFTISKKYDSKQILAVEYFTTKILLVDGGQCVF